MKIQRNPLKNKTIINPSKLRLNSKIIKRFTNSSIKTSKTSLDKKNLNFIYMALNKTILQNVNSARCGKFPDTGCIRGRSPHCNPRQPGSPAGLCSRGHRSGSFPREDRHPVPWRVHRS